MSSKFNGYLQSEAKCPNCHKELPRIPTRKSKCPSCGKVFYVRKRISTNKRYIVTSEEALKIEAEWTRHKDKATTFRGRVYNYALPETGEDYKSMFKLAHSYMNREYYDESFNLYQSAKAGAIHAGDNLVYLEILLDMAELFSKENKYKQALAIYCEYNYLCLCGIDNIQTVNELVDVGLIDNTYYGKPWNPDKMGVSNLEVFSMDFLAHELKLDQKSFESLIIDTCKNVYSEFDCPFEAEEALPYLINLVYGRGNMTCL